MESVQARIQDFGMGGTVERRRREYRGAAGAEGRNEARRGPSIATEYTTVQFFLALFNCNGDYRFTVLSTVSLSTYRPLTVIS